MNLAPYHGEGKPSCTKAVYLQYAGADIHLNQGGFILVNGKEVTSLPVKVGDIRIRAASSLFIMSKYLVNPTHLCTKSKPPLNVLIRNRYHSKLFIFSLVQLPGKVSLWWDGATRVFVDVPPVFQDKTQVYFCKSQHSN